VHRARGEGGRGTQAGLSKIELACTVATAIATVVGVVIAYGQCRDDPPVDLGGDVVGAFVESVPSGLVRGQFEIKGFKGKTCEVRASVLEAANGSPVAGLTNQPVLSLKPEADTDRAVFPMTVKLPAAPGRYFVSLVLFDPEGNELDRHNTDVFQVGQVPGSTTTTTDPRAYPNALERTLLTHIPQASQTRCQRADPLNLGDTAGVRCEPAIGATAVWYYQFGDLTRLRNAYGASVTRTRVTGGECTATAWHGDITYPIGNATGGRMLCYAGSDNRQWVEWTNERRLILAQANSPNARILFDWWRTSAGPQ